MEYTEVSQVLYLVAVIALVIAFAQLICKNVWCLYRLRNVEGPRGVPFLGNVLQFGTSNVDFFNALTRWCNKFRDNGFYKLFIGFQPAVVIYNPYDVEKILRDTSLDNKGMIYKLAEPWIGNGLVSSKGSKWVTRRKLLTPSFHFSILSKFLPIFNKHAQILAGKLSEFPDGFPVDFAPLITSCTLDAMYETIMGLNLESQKGQNQDYLHATQTLTDILMTRIWCPWYWNETLFRLTSLGREYVKCLKIIHQTSTKVIRERKLENEKKVVITIDDNSLEVRKRRRLAFLDLLIEAQKQHGDFTDEGIQEEVNTFMFAGHETVSTSVLFAMYLIGRHPNVQRKIQEELEAVFGNDSEREVTSEDLPKLEYLSCVMKESQRIMTAAPFIARQPESDVEVCGTTLPKGTLLIIGLYWLHQDPKQFPNPDTFDPDRFSEADNQGRHNFAFVPFSAGHRNCIGQKFAIMEQKVILATLLRKLDVKSEQDISTLKVHQRLTLKTTEDIKIVFTPRKQHCSA